MKCCSIKSNLSNDAITSAKMSSWPWLESGNAHILDESVPA